MASIGMPKIPSLNSDSPVQNRGSLSNSQMIRDSEPVLFQCKNEEVPVSLNQAHLLFLTPWEKNP